MKKKFIATVITALFVVSLTTISLAAAYPTGYTLEQSGTGFAELSSDQWHSFNAALKIGTVGTADRAAVVFDGGPKLSEITSLSYWDYSVQGGTFNQLTAWVSIYLDDRPGRTLSDWFTDYGGGSTHVEYLQAEPYYTYADHTGHTDIVPTMNMWWKWDAFDASIPLTWASLGSGSEHNAPTLAQYIAGTEGASYQNNHVSYGDLYIVAIKIRMGYGGPWANTLAYVDDVNINDYTETFGAIPRQAKQDAIIELVTLKDGYTGAIAKKINEAIGKITESLKESLWMSDIRLKLDKGQEVFDREKEAVKNLMDLINDGKVPSAVKTECMNIINKLLGADKTLAAVQLHDAKVLGSSNSKVLNEISISQEELLKAEQEIAKFHYDSAVDHYKKAWEHARNAYRISLGPNVFPLYNWYDGTYHDMTADNYVGSVAFKTSSGSLGIDITLVSGRPLTTYNVLLWHDYATPGQGYWTIGTLTTDSYGSGHTSITYPLSAGTYSLGLDLQTSSPQQEILSAGNGLYGLQNSITIPP